MVSSLLAINILICLCFVNGGNAQRNVVKVLRVGNGGQWGNWGSMQFCAVGTYAVGYKMKIESKQGRLRDDTSLNGIRLECATRNGIIGGEVTSTEGPWGNWDGGPTECNQGNFLKQFALQVEKGPHRDDTAANFVKFMCQDYLGNSQSYEIVRDPGQGFWGSFGGYSESCDNGSAVCGLKTRVEQRQGRLKDDTALNDVEMYCCSD